MEYFNLFLLSLLLSITPGSNNIMVMVSGVNFPRKKVYPLVFGIAMGGFLMCCIAGFGLDDLLEDHLWFRRVMAVGACGYLLYLAWKFGTTKSFQWDEKPRYQKPPTFFQAFTLQWINPKAWGVIISLVSVYDHADCPVDTNVRTFFITCIITIAMFLTKIFWLYGGVFVKKYFKNEKSQRAFNITMGILLVLTALPLAGELND